MARRLQNRLALAQFKTSKGWEDLTLDTIEPRVEEELRRKRLSEGDALSDSSSSASDMPYYPSSTNRARGGLMSSPLKAPFFSDAVGSSNGSSAGQRRKRTYMASAGGIPSSSPSKRLRSSPAALGGGRRPFHGGPAHQLTQSSPIKPRRHQQHFTTSAGPDVSFFPGTRRIADALTSPNYAAASDDDDDLLPAHSFRASIMHSSPPSTPPRNRGAAVRRSRQADAGAAAADGGPPKTGEEGADLLLYLAASPSPANPSSGAGRSRMDPPSTPPPRNTSLALPSSMMTTPGGGNLFPNTPGQGFDFADFVNITPSPAQKPWKTPVAGSLAPGGKTPLSVARRRLTFDEQLHGF